MSPVHAIFGIEPGTLNTIVQLVLLAVVVTAATQGRGPAVLSAVVNVLAFDVLFVPPRLSFAVTDARYTGPVRANRVAVTRTKLYHSNGVFRFHGGHTVVYRAPVITQRYYNYSIRPTLIVENYPAQYGYIWVNGSWNWSGNEWLWTGGHYAPDPAIGVYYDDGSYDVADEYVDDASLDADASGGDDGGDYQE